MVIATVNAQSLRSKELQLRDIIQDHLIDAIVATETWLSTKDSDWWSMTVLNRHDLSLYTHHRQWGRGDGLALVCKSHLKVKRLNKGETHSFKFTT